MKDGFKTIADAITVLESRERQLPDGWRYMWDTTDPEADPVSVLYGSEYGGTMLCIDYPLRKDQGGCYQIHYRP